MNRNHPLWEKGGPDGDTATRTRSPQSESSTSCEGTHQIGIPGATAKDKENRRIPFNPNGRLAAILQRRAALGSDAFVFGSTHGAYQPTIQTAWETLNLLANGLEPKAGEEGVKWNAEQLRRIDLRWHDLRHHAESRIMPTASGFPRGCLGDLGTRPLAQSA